MPAPYSSDKCTFGRSYEACRYGLRKLCASWSLAQSAGCASYNCRRGGFSKMSESRIAWMWDTGEAVSEVQGPSKIPSLAPRLPAQSLWGRALPHPGVAAAQAPAYFGLRTAAGCEEAGGPQRPSGAQGEFCVGSAPSGHRPVRVQWDAGTRR